MTQLDNTEEEVSDIINFIEDIQSYTRDLLHTINVEGDAYVKSQQFRDNLEFLKGMVAMK